MQHLNKNLQSPCTHKLSIPGVFQIYLKLFSSCRDIFRTLSWKSFYAIIVKYSSEVFLRLPGVRRLLLFHVTQDPQCHKMKTSLTVHHLATQGTEEEMWKESWIIFPIYERKLSIFECILKSYVYFEINE